MALDAAAFSAAVAKFRGCGSEPTSIVISERFLTMMRRDGWYDPTHPIAFLDYVKRTSPKPKLS